jgi:hypothetical protein
MARATFENRSSPGVSRRAHTSRAAQLGTCLIVLSALGCGTTSGDADKTGAGGTGAAENFGRTGGSGAGGEAKGGAGAGGALLAAGGGGGRGGGLGGNGPACPGSVTPPGYPTCREQADCAAPTLCMASPPNTTGICGACFASPAECTTDGDCGANSVCAPGPANPCQCMGPGKVCKAACSSDSCAPGEVCGSDRHCRVASCDSDGFVCGADATCARERAGNAHGCAPSRCDTEGFSCPVRTTCSPGAGADAHGCRLIHCKNGAACAENTDCDSNSAVGDGCVRRACETDGDCDCGVCALGQCQSQLFVCVNPLTAYPP